MISLPYEWQIGWRYTRSGKRSGNGFISFISAISMIGIALGVAALIIVLSVMNGFQREVRDRMLSVISHIEVYSYDGESMSEKPQAMQVIERNPRVQSVAPFVLSQALLARGDEMRGILIRGIDPAQEHKVSDFLKAQPQLQNALQELKPESFNTILGIELARALGVDVGDSVTMVVPGGQAGPAGIVPRLKQFTVVGLLDSGHFEYDSSLALTSMRDAALLTRSAAGLRVKLKNLDDAQLASAQISQQLGSDYLVRDWTQQNRNWFSAVQLEKRMMFIILTLISAVAAFNLVSTLVMTVTDKTPDIAILRTLGASPGSIMRIFFVQGASVGLLGTAIGLGLGLLVACNIESIFAFLERLLHMQFIPKDVYFINRMPSDPRADFIIPIVLVSIALSFVMTLYPSWRASRLQPAAALR